MNLLTKQEFDELIAPAREGSPRPRLTNYGLSKLDAAVKKQVLLYLLFNGMPIYEALIDEFDHHQKRELTLRGYTNRIINGGGLAVLVNDTIYQNMQELKPKTAEPSSGVTLADFAQLGKRKHNK